MHKRNFTKPKVKKTTKLIALLSGFTPDSALICRLLPKHINIKMCITELKLCLNIMWLLNVIPMFRREINFTAKIREKLQTKNI